MLAITICATKSYSYALIAQARRVQAAIEREPAGIVILVGDKSQELARAEKFYREILPGEGWRVVLLTGPFEDGLPNYKNAAQLVIARMRSLAFDRARKEKAKQCWSLDSDVLPPANALRVMQQMLAFDDGFYGVSTCPYPSQGGGAFLGGRGTPENPILPDFYDDERELAPELKARIDVHKAQLEEFQKAGAPPDEAWQTERVAIGEEVKKSPPIGNVFFCNSKGFRRRGWMDAAYPGLGLGAVLPSDWCGFGCTLMNRPALSLAQFDGYDGGGTEDLYIVWKRWYRAGVRINVIPHAPCDHVIRDPEKKGQYLLCQAHHEMRDPECVGHLRLERRPWFQQVEGEAPLR